MSRANVLALVTAALWALWSMTERHALKTAGPYGVALALAVAVLLTSFVEMPVLWRLMQRAEEPSPWPVFGWVLLSAVTLCVAGVVYGFAMKTGRPGVVTALASSYPAIIAVGMMVTGREPFSARVLLGVFMVVGGAALVSRE
jgi:drug/metabolite transporter (DMT)-like permease